MGKRMTDYKPEMCMTFALFLLCAFVLSNTEVMEFFPSL